MKLRVFICFLIYIFSRFFLSSVTVAAPMPDIKANNLDGSITLDSSNTLSITLSLNAGGSDYLNADWWILADTPFGWYYYVAPHFWYNISDFAYLKPVYQGAISTISPIELLNISDLPDGIYAFYFAVDTVMNGQIDWGRMHHDGVVVNITPTVLRAAPRNPGPYAGIDALLIELEDQSYKDSDYKLVQGRNWEYEIGPAHNQYNRQCWMTAAQMVGEYLGYAMHVPDSHFDVQSQDFGGAIDVGYWGSQEHLSVYHSEIARINPSITHPPTTDYAAAQGTQQQCSTLFGAGTLAARLPDYGECNGNTANFTWAGFQLLGGGSTIVEDFQEWMLDEPLMGCNDYHDYAVTSDAGDIYEREDARRIIKAFIDNNLPVIVRVRDGHNNVVVGYTELWSDGLPDTAILVDAGTTGTGDIRYRLAQELNTAGAWDQGTDFSIDRIRPWHANLNMACEDGGWARELDDSLWTFSVCDTPKAPDGLACAHNEDSESISERRYFGINIECWTNGHLKHDFHAAEENPFVTIGHNVTCDDLVVRYANANDTRRTLNSAEVKRYGYNNTDNKWFEMSSYSGDAGVARQAGRHAAQYMVSFPQWASNTYMAADNLSSPNTKRRTTIDLSFDNGDHLYVELAPPRTYGVEIKCIQGSRAIEYWSEADNGMTWFVDRSGPGSPYISERQFIYSGANRVCDDVELTLSLGANERRIAPFPTITRYGYDIDADQWQKLNTSAPWSPDFSEIVSSADTGLTGNTYRFRWEETWPDNYFFVATNLGGSQPERKTRFEVDFNRFGNGPRRRIEISPF